MGTELVRIQAKGIRVLSKTPLKHAALTERIIGVYYEVYRELGHGFLESVYEEAFAVALMERGLRFQRQIALEVWFRGRKVGNFRADYIVEDSVLVELKAVRTLTDAHDAQLLNYLSASSIEVGLVMNFGPKPRFLRRLLDNNRKTYHGRH